MEHTARTATRLYRQILENIDTDIALFDAECRYEYINPIAVRDPVLRQWLIGKTDEEYCLAKGKDPTIGRNRMRIMREAIEQNRVTQMEEILTTKDGDTRHIVRKWCPVREPGGNVSKLIGYGFDVSERKKAEEALRLSEQHLRQAQKMEAIGSLAGGIAHDFNNLLTAITCNCQMVLSDLEPSDPHRAEIEEISKAAERAAVLTRQLLAFGRKEMLQPKAVDLNTVIRQLEGMLRRLIPENIELLTDLEPSLKVVSADPGQLEQIIVNLVLNARDAMPEGGRLTIATRNAGSDGAGISAEAGADATSHILLSISDTGHGMDDSVRERAFEPFFTTKNLGKGTGLGLSTVYGIVTRSGGEISISSAVRRGTVVRVSLPSISAVADAGAAQTPRTSFPGSETVLVVEDEEAVRRLVVRILSKVGYRVLAACNGREALARLATHGGSLDLVLTDLVMPEMGGGELADRLAGTHPEVRILFMSGYSNDDSLTRGLAQSGRMVLQKPFTPEDLEAVVRQALDRPPNA